MKVADVVTVFSRYNSPFRNPYEPAKQAEIALDKRVREALIVMCLDSDSRIPYKLYTFDGTQYLFIRCRWDDIIRIARLQPWEVKTAGYYISLVTSSLPCTIGFEAQGCFYRLGVEGLWPRYQKCEPGKNCMG